MEQLKFLGISAGGIIWYNYFGKLDFSYKLKLKLVNSVLVLLPEKNENVYPYISSTDVCKMFIATLFIIKVTRNT